MNVELKKEHQWLERLGGYWTFEMEASMSPGAPTEKLAGKEHVRFLGGAWALCEGRSEMPDGSTFLTVTTLGYDPAKGCFVGTFVGSMMTYLWVYEGQLAPGGEALVLDTEGPDFSGVGGLAKYQDEIEFVAPDHRVLRSRVRGPDGTWTTFMTAHYRRERATS